MTSDIIDWLTVLGLLFSILIALYELFGSLSLLT